MDTRIDSLVLDDPALSPGRDPADLYRREEQTFPVLPGALIDAVRPFAHGEEHADGALLFERGEREADLLLVLEGEVAVIESDEEGEHEIHAHRPGEFTGELDLLSGREILVSGRARGAARVLRVPHAMVRDAVMGHPELGEIVMRAFELRRAALIRHGQGAVALLGEEGDGHLLRLRQFLARSSQPHRMLEAAPEALRHLGLSPGDLPAILLPGGDVLKRPEVPALADALGMTEPLDEARVHDVAVVGAGPAGLAAAVYAASEGLDAAVVEGLAPGGQAGTSSKIENYLGFPTGISGQALAGRAVAQAQKFGARLMVSRHAAGLDCGASPFRIRLDDGRHVFARTVILATGARYRRLSVLDYDRIEGEGIHYAATAIEAQLCRDGEVAIVGGGNSSGQAAMHLSRFARQVHVLCRAGASPRRCRTTSSSASRPRRASPSTPAPRSCGSRAGTTWRP